MARRTWREVAVTGVESAATVGCGSVGCPNGSRGGQHHGVPFKVYKMATADKFYRAVSTLLKIGFIFIHVGQYQVDDELA